MKREDMRYVCVSNIYSIECKYAYVLQHIIVEFVCRIYTHTVQVWQPPGGGAWRMVPNICATTRGNSVCVCVCICVPRQFGIFEELARPMT